MHRTLKIAARTSFHFHSNILRFAFFSILCFILGGCPGLPPNEDYALANVAIESARSAGAPKVSVGYWNRALSEYKKGEELFEDRNYGAAQESFIRARTEAERAENSARLKRLRSGEVF